MMFGQFQRSFDRIFFSSKARKLPPRFFLLLEDPFDVGDIRQRISGDGTFDQKIRRVGGEKQLLRWTIDFRLELNVEFLEGTRRAWIIIVPIRM